MSFRLKTILGVALIEITLLLFLVWSSMDQMRRSSELQLIQQAETTSSLFSSMVKDSVLSYDLATVETFVSELMSNPGLVYVRVYDQQQLLAVGGRDVASTQPFHPDQSLETVTDTVFDISAPIRESGILYGRVELGISTQQVEERLDNATWRSSLLASTEILISALFSFILGSWLVKQLEVLRRASSEISSGKLGHQIPVKGNDEIAETIRYFNQMSVDLEESILHLNLLNTSLEEQVAERTLTLSQTNQQLSSIMENMADTLFVLNQEQQIIIHNPAAERLFSCGNDHFHQLQFKELFPEHRYPKIEEMMMCEEVCTENFVLSSDEESQILSVTLSPLPADMGMGQKLVLIRDITEQQKLEEKEQMIAFQSGVTDMSSSIMHNIGNIITGLQGHLLKVQMGSKHLNKAGEVIKHRLDQSDDVETLKGLVRLIDELIAHTNSKFFTQSTEGLSNGLRDIGAVIHLQNSHSKPNFRQTEFHPSFFFDDVIAMLDKKIKQYGIEVFVEIEPGVESLKLPRNQLFQVILRVMNNGIAAIEKSGNEMGEIEVRLMRESRNGKSGVRITVLDNGIGIERERLTKIFAFAHTSQGGGGGFGLHESSNFIKAFGGTIELHSEGVGTGAMVEIWMPS
ncbi:MAG: HAMP domain-containing protein [Gammaproteobacteria bacterium]|nr:HAMP domain-containing protein [Gammaproteobacteria bacterium]MBT3488105.1 HAMP domain-containing protein [Gammaproteobacteria bacterium]MBT3719561.1 HAMP domain-containing protein [Gammaproteobacteria bacterium]MBT3844909.1 HAMP domain-containing protein [Gammaproteobacteria bacterium]MBT3893896.1 HAMP domain-containing protein [Gammaproteobacteria bacterium]